MRTCQLLAAVLVLLGCAQSGYGMAEERIGPDDREHPTVRQPGRIRTLPDCAACHEADPDAFGDCARRLVLVHALCNKAIWRAGDHG